MSYAGTFKREKQYNLFLQNLIYPMLSELQK